MQSRKKIIAVVMLALIVAVAGCSSWESNVYATLSASRATILEARNQYTVGNIPHTETNRLLINNAERIHNDAVTAAHYYVEAKLIYDIASGVDKSDALTKMQRAQSAVSGALVDLSRIVGEIKAISAKK